jgi:hypothetical protein
MENYPSFQKEYLYESNNLITTKFKSYLTWSNLVVAKINNESPNIEEVPLTFYPIAKNIRFASSYMTKNIFENKRSIILNSARNGEVPHWQNELNRGKWYPWLWSRGRIEGDYKNSDGWNYYFNSLNNNKLNPIGNNDNIEEPDNKHKLFYIYLACLKYTFNLNEQYLKLIEQNKNSMKWPTSGNVLAVQIRRGEICTKTCTKSHREIFDLNTYIEKVESMISQNNFEYIYISTDSNEEIDKLKEARPEWKLLYLPLDRTQFFRMDESKSVGSNGFARAQDLEDSCRLNIDSIPFIVDSALMDLYFISICQGYISTITDSEFSRLGWYLQMSTQEKLTPYINLNNKELNLDTRDMLLLL